MTTSEGRMRRNVQRQEAVVSALHALIGDNDEARKACRGLVTGVTHRGNYDFSLDAVDVALTRIMETFGYVVTPIQ